MTEDTSGDYPNLLNEKNPTESYVSLGVHQSWYVKNSDLVYTSMSADNSKAIGVDGGIYHPDMRWTSENLPWEGRLAAVSEENDLEVLNTGIPSRSTVVTVTGAGEWVHATTTKWRTSLGGIRGEAVIVDIRDMYNGWANRLDRTTKRLYLAKNNYLVEKDLIMLHLIVQGLSRKQIATLMYVSLKAIEKRLTKIKMQFSLYQPELDHESINASLHRLNLTEFLAVQPNWFSMNQMLSVHVR